ncbi:MAG: hypothetical protein OFPI_28280 [Osedax symbiont Rs2]|nr:MAG: hypothetical protein OFPI_28280 [Osedax symbiont Rs2]
MRLIYIILLIVSSELQGAVKASVDRVKASYGQTIQLNISSDNALGKSPNLTLLKRSFKVIGSSKVSRPYIKNSQRSQKTLWFFILKPKRSGNLTIPAININGEKTSPIRISVTGRQTRTSSSEKLTRSKPVISHDIIVKATINKNKLYPNEILVYQLSVDYPDKSSADFQVKAPFIAGAIILPLAQPSYSKHKVRSKNRTLRTQSFAIFSEKVAYYQIEPAAISFSDKSNGDKTQQVTLKANNLHFEITPKANHNSLGYWLPSRKIKLSDSWQLPQQIQVGDSITRTIELSAQGINADILPLMSALTHKNVQIKLLDVSIQNSIEDGVLLAIRREKVSMTFTKAGNVSLAPLDIHWWNTDVDQARIASVNAKSFLVTAPSVELDSQMDSNSLVTGKLSGKTQLASVSTQARQVVSQGSVNGKSWLSSGQLNWIILVLFTLLVTSTSGWLYSSRKNKK